MGKSWPKILSPEDQQKLFLSLKDPINGGLLLQVTMNGLSSLAKITPSNGWLNDDVINIFTESINLHVRLRCKKGNEFFPEFFILPIETIL